MPHYGSQRPLRRFLEHDSAHSHREGLNKRLRDHALKVVVQAEFAGFGPDDPAAWIRVHDGVSSVVLNAW